MAGLAVLGGTVTASAQASAGAPAWKLTVASEPTNFMPGAAPQGFGSFGRYPAYDIVATNVGAGPSSGPITITDTLPEGLTPVVPAGRDSGIEGDFSDLPCVVFGQSVTCTDPHSIGPGRFVQVAIPVLVSLSASAGVLNEASIVGGGSGEARATTTTAISSAPAPFGIASGSAGLSLALTGDKAAPVTQAGSHPYQVTMDLGFPTTLGGDGNLVGAGHLREMSIHLPRGMVFDPTATPTRCTEAQLEGNRCPDSSAVGFAGFQTILLSPEVGASPLYNMVPPSGVGAELGINPFGVNMIFIHLLGGLNTAEDYELSFGAHELLARSLNPIISVQVQLWGDPSDPSHDGVRGECVFGGAACPVDASETPLLTMPGSCLGPLTLSVAIDSWEAPSQSYSYGARTEDALGEAVGLDGCNKLAFEPRIEAKPTTNLADSPSGLDLDLHLPQSQDLGRLSDANLRDVKLTLPERMAPNPSFAVGTSSCGPVQIGLATSPGQEPVHFTGAPASCPQASKLGTVEIKTPLLDHPLSGAVYLSQPYENPFHSLLAIYLAIDDLESGVVIKLAGKVEVDFQSGQLTVSFKESPELPFEEFKVHLFGGPRSLLRTPATCATYAITSTITPWSTPEGGNATPSDSFATRVAPDGAMCPTVGAEQPDAPSFTVGTIAPRAGAHSPFVLRLSREDGSQRLAGIETTLPEGLLAELTGFASCPDTAIARAQTRNKSNGGALEQQNPSCPASSEIGTVTVGAGAGLTPLYLQGHAYLAGSYKGAPLSLATITPVVAGPFDLGVVVVRTALQVDPETARIHAVSDPLPQALDGIPLDLRSVSMRLDRPDFTLNPTSCDPMTVPSTAISALGSVTDISPPFQVGNCHALGLEPKLSLRPRGDTGRGGHPSLRAALTFLKGHQTDLAGLQLRLPRSLALDPFRLCTQRQLIARQCSARSVYGHAMARTPLLDQPLRGPLSLRPSKQGPELVATLKGEGIEIISAAKLETVGGRLIASFEAIPDAPVSKVVLQIDGGRKGLLVNRASLCKKSGRAEALFSGQNAKTYESSPPLAVPCKSPPSRRSKGAHR